MGMWDTCGAYEGTSEQRFCSCPREARQSSTARDVSFSNVASDGGRWDIIRGAIDPGGTPARAAIRETREETGLEIAITRLIGVFSGPEFQVTFANGDRTHYV